MDSSSIIRPFDPQRARFPIVPLALGLLLASALAAPADAAGWPRQFDSPSGTFIIYQPQPETLNGDLLAGRAAFSLQRSGDANPVFGVLWFNEHVVVDRDSSTVMGRDFDVTKVRLPGITTADASRYESLVEQEALRWDLSGSVEELQAGLASAEKERASVADLDTLPPRIIFSQERAILVVYDGSPVLEPIEGSKLERVANTPYVVVYDPSRREYFLTGANLWYSATDPLGAWRLVPRPPDEVAAVVPPDTAAADQIQGPPPRVLTATEPTELITTDGPPAYAPLVGDELLYITNTESDVIREVSSQRLYVLLAGRWYRAATPAGPWAFVRGDRLPASFRRVPPESPKANILASVAGTDAADDAVADAEIPQTSAIRRDDPGIEVAYDGSPQFEPVPGTSLQYAVNTDAQVILADGRFYACDQGVWYVADRPEGPWQVSETRPLSVDDIPPSCPVYDVRYVFIYDATPEVVYVGYLPGYLGCYPYYGTVVYGTGYHYRPWRGHRHFYPRPCTWGFHPRYNPWLARWSFGFSYMTGFIRPGVLWRPESRPRAPHDPPRWFGPGGYRRPLLAGDMTMIRSRRAVRMPTRPAGSPPMNLYHRTANLPRVDRTATRMPARPVAAPAARPPSVPNNVFAGRDGKVYRRDDGGWKVNQGRTWGPAPVATAPPETPAPRPAPPPPTIRNWPTARPTPQRAPAAPVSPPGPAAPANPPRVTPSPRPAAPAVGSNPGNLEREWRGRSRVGAGPAAPKPSQAPEKGREKEKEKPAGKS